MNPQNEETNERKFPSLHEIQDHLDEMESQSWDPEPTSPSPFPSESLSANKTDKQPVEPGAKSLVLSTLLSLGVVLILLGTVRLLLPQMLEWGRYAWTRGQLRAEYEMAGVQLRQVSMDGLTQVSSLLGQRVSPSVVHIDLKGSQSRGKLGLLESLRIEQGSGVIVDERGYILTNHHVIEREGLINVQLSDGRVLNADIVGIDPVTDLAILKVDADNLMPISWGDSDKVNVGMPVWAVGSPFGLTGSVTFGILSGKHRIDLSAINLQGSVKSQAEYSDLMQSDVAVNPGNSGGPLVNAQGELIGINTAIIGEHYRGVSFSIPSNVVRKVYTKLLATGKMERGVLGLLIDRDYHPKKTGEGIVGVRIEGFANGKASPASKAGLLEGDIILRVNDIPVEDLRDLKRVVGEAYIGSVAEVVVSRDHSEMTFEVPISPLPEPFLP